MLEEPCARLLHAPLFGSSDPIDRKPQIEQEVMSLVARILGGGQRPESQPTKALVTQRQPEKEPAKKPLTVKVGRQTSGR